MAPRSLGEQWKWGLGTVNGVQGMILLPDEWAGSALVLTPEYGREQYANNVYTLEQWTAMEAGGAVFLPAAGYRYRSTTQVGYINGPYDDVIYRILLP